MIEGSEIEGSDLGDRRVGEDVEQGVEVGAELNGVNDEVRMPRRQLPTNQQRVHIKRY